MDKLKENIKHTKRQIITNLVFVVVVIVVIGAVNYFYLVPQTQLVEDLVVAPGLTIDADKSRAQFIQIKEELLNNKDFTELKKYKDWPIVDDGMLMGNARPFLEVYTNNSATVVDSAVDGQAN